MTTRLKSIRIDGKEVNINDLDLNIINKYSGALHVRRTDRDFETIGLFGVFFIFKDSIVKSIFINQSNEEYLGKIVLIDYDGNEVDIQDKYNLVSMIYCDVTSHYIKGSNVSTYRTINDYDNIECKLSANKRGITLMYDIHTGVLVDRLEKIMNSRKRFF